MVNKLKVNIYESRFVGRSIIYLGLYSFVVTVLWSLLRDSLRFDGLSLIFVVAGDLVSKGSRKSVIIGLVLFLSVVILFLSAYLFGITIVEYSKPFINDALTKIIGIMIHLSIWIWIIFNIFILSKLLISFKKSSNQKCIIEENK